jgi:hypothetical protein
MKDERLLNLSIYKQEPLTICCTNHPVAVMLGQYLQSSACRSIRLDTRLAPEHMLVSYFVRWTGTFRMMPGRSGCQGLTLSREDQSLAPTWKSNGGSSGVISV